MQLSTLAYMTYRNFKNRTSRILFTVLGVAVAIAVVLSLVSFGYGLQKSLLERITTAEALLSLDMIPSDPSVIRFDRKMYDEITALPSVAEVSPQAEFGGQMALGDEYAEAQVNAIRASFFNLDGRTPLAGRFFNDGEKQVVVVDTTVAELFSLTAEELIGRTIRLSAFVPVEQEAENANSLDVTNGHVTVIETIPLGELTIVGVTEASTNVGAVYLDAQNLPEGAITTYAFAKVRARSETQLEELQNELLNRGFLVSSLSDIVAQANRIFSAIQLTLGVFGIFALVVAAIGLVNTMTISLLERTNEIGIMRAIGGAPSDIRRIFLTESVVIGILGGITGILLGILMSELLNALFNLLANSLGGERVRLFVYPIWFIFFTLALSTAVGFLGGVWPAQRAAKMNPLEALRYK